MSRKLSLVPASAGFLATALALGSATAHAAPSFEASGESSASARSEPGADDASAGRGRSRDGVGLTVMPELSFGILTYNYGVTVDGDARYEIPQWVAGGGATLAYDLGRDVHVDQLFLRASGGYLAGEGGSQMSVGLVPVDLAFEKGLRLSSSSSFFGALGPSATYALVALPNQKLGAEHLNALVFGALALAGFQQQFSRELGLRLELFSRVNLSTADYHARGPGIPAAFQRRSDHYSTIGYSMALTWTL